MSASVNKSLNKVRVQRVLGGMGVLGMMEPQVNMLVRHGIDKRWIASLDSGNYQIGLSLASGGTVTSKAYPHELFIDAFQASGFGWPSDSHDTQFGHNGIFPNGVPPAVGSGMVELGGDGLFNTFSRNPVST